MVTPMKKAMMVVQAAAKAEVPVSAGSGGGGLRGSIYTDVETSGDHVTGICYTNSEYAPYVEFGTGPAGQESHEGISPNVKVMYRQKGWIIPARAMSEEDAKMYGFPIMRNEMGEVVGYATRGQRAQPFMYPALKNNRGPVIRELSKAISDTHKGICDD